MDDLFNIFYYSTFLITAAISIAILVLIPKLKNFDFSNRVLYSLLLLLSINDIASTVFAHYFASNLVFISTCAIIELVCIYIFLRSISTDSKKIYDVIFLCFLTFSLYEFLSLDFYNFGQFQLYSKSLNSSFLLFIVMKKIIENLRNVQKNKWIKVKLLFAFFLTMGIVLNLPLNILVNNDGMLVYVIWFINLINYIILNIGIFHHLWKVKPQNNV